MRAVKKRIGDRVTLMCDFNQRLTVNEAIRAGRVLDDEGLYWIEEPVRHDDYEGYARIAPRWQTPIQTGENLVDTFEMAQAIALRSLDFVMPDVQRIGGVTGWLRAAALAHAHGIEMSSHLFPEFSVPSARRHAHLPLARVHGLGGAGAPGAAPGRGRRRADPRPARRGHRVGRGRGQALRDPDAAMPIKAVTLDAYGTLVRNEDLRSIPRRIVADHQLAVDPDDVLRHWVDLYHEAVQASPFRTLRQIQADNLGRVLRRLDIAADPTPYVDLFFDVTTRVDGSTPRCRRRSPRSARCPRRSCPTPITSTSRRGGSSCPCASC